MIVTFPSRPGVRITTDPYNFIVERLHTYGEKSKTPGEQFWKSETFHPSIDQAVAAILKRDVLDNDDTLTVQELLRFMQRQADCMRVRATETENSTAD